MRQKRWLIYSGLVFLFLGARFFPAQAATCSAEGPYYNCWVCDQWDDWETCGECCVSWSFERLDSPSSSFLECNEYGCGQSYGCSDPFWEVKYTRNICLYQMCQEESSTVETYNANYCNDIYDLCSTNADCMPEPEETPTPTPEALTPTPTPETPISTPTPSPTPRTPAPTPTSTPLLPGERYECDASTWTCYSQESGSYPTLAECQADCPPSVSPNYECDTSTWSCYEDEDGSYDTLASCQADCQLSPLPPPPSGPGWFQTEGGDVHSNYESIVGESVFSDIPTTAIDSFFSLESTESGRPNPYLLLSTSGVVSGSQAPMSFGQGSVSTRGWRIDAYSGQLYMGTPLPRFDYQYFHDTLGLGAKAGHCPHSDGSHLGPGKVFYKCSSGWSVAGRDWNVSSGDQIVIFVEGGELRIKNKIKVEKNGFLAFIVDGDILIEGSVGTDDFDDSDGIETVLDAVLIANGKIKTGNSHPTKPRLVASGIFVAYGGFEFQRDLGDDNETAPAELFLYRPDFVISAPDEFKKSTMTWQEVAP